MKKTFYLLSILMGVGLNDSFAQHGKPLFTNAIGVQAYTYRNSFPNGVAAVLDSIKALGITEMEGPNPKNISAEEFKKMLDERGIRMPSIGIDYSALMEDPEAAIKLAKLFGAKFIMVAWIPHGKTFTINDAKKAVDDFNHVGEILEKNGITFCYHDHGYEFVPYFSDDTLLDYIIQNTNPKYVSFEMDVMWTFHGGGDPANLLRRYKDRWKLVHLKDIRKGVANDFTGGTDTHNDVAVGTGQIDYAVVLKAAKAVGIKHYFIEDESPDHATQIPVTIAYIKSLRE